jgi:hypothetical protein
MGIKPSLIYQTDGQRLIATRNSLKKLSWVTPDSSDEYERCTQPVERIRKAETANRRERRNCKPECPAIVL